MKFEKKKFNKIKVTSKRFDISARGVTALSL